jgi:hypothetical protein
MHVKLHFNQKCPLKMGGMTKTYIEGISVASHFHVYENEDAVSNWRKFTQPGTDVMIFKNTFAEKFSENIGVFCTNYS